MSTPANEAIFANMLSLQVVSTIQQAHIDGKIDRQVYNELFEIAQKAQKQAQKLVDILEQEKGQSR